MSGLCLRPAGRPVQYSGQENGNVPFSLFCHQPEKPPPSRKACSSGVVSRLHNPIAMREAAEPAHDVGVVVRVFQVFRIAGLAEKLDATQLV